MDLPEFLHFTPVTVRRTHNGWLPDRQRAFIVALARGASVNEAATGLGRSRQSAYMLRARHGAESFAAAWNRALDFAREARVVGQRTGDLCYETETLFVPRFYGGRLLGFVQRPDHRNILATLRQLERVIERSRAQRADQACHN
ncbi:MAG: hypothetical protein LH485_07125 [Sphingomonas bacterium]|nr:hypothetical protein [Sphingomonas bacterium]